MLEHNGVVDAVASQDWTPTNEREIVAALRALSGLVNRVVDGTNAVEGRLALLERRLSMSTDWVPDPDDLAEQFLWLTYRCDGGDGIGERDEEEDPATVTWSSLVNLAHGTLRPRSLAQLNDCLQIIAHEVAVLVNDAQPERPDPNGIFGFGPADDEDKQRLAKVMAAAQSKRVH